jgi:uncharacterized protein (TIGR03086 family)
VTLLGLLDESLSYADLVVAGIGKDQALEPTPCPDFTVEHLVEHLVNGLAWYGGLPVGGDTDPRNVSGPDVGEVGYGPAFASAAASVRTNWTQAGLATSYAMPFGAVTGEGITEFQVVEVLVHAWDLAVATGQPARPADELAERALEVARRLPEDALREPGMMAEPVSVPESAPALDRLVAFLGRRPAA